MGLIHPVLTQPLLSIRELALFELVVFEIVMTHYNVVLSKHTFSLVRYRLI